MMFNEVIERFVEQSAVSVMFRGTLENQGQRALCVVLAR
jgi:hypothetical protein